MHCCCVSMSHKNMMIDDGPGCCSDGTKPAVCVL